MYAFAIIHSALQLVVQLSLPPQENLLKLNSSHLNISVIELVCLISQNEPKQTLTKKSLIYVYYIIERNDQY